VAVQQIQISGPSFRAEYSSFHNIIHCSASITGGIESELFEEIGKVVVEGIVVFH
jgi:hypothetical protein